MGKTLISFEKNINLVRHLAFASILLFISAVILNYLDYLPSFWNLVYIFYLVIFVNVFWITLKINQIPEEKRKDSAMIYIFSYLFLLTLIIFTANQFLKQQIISDFTPYLAGLSISFGFLIFYASRNRVEKEIEQEKVDEESAEKKRLGEFDKKFPRIAKIWGLKQIVRCMYKEGWWYVLALFVLIIIGLWLRLRYVGQLSFWFDEATSILTARRINEGFGQTFLNGIVDNRAWIYHHYLAYLFALFPKISIYLMSRLANIPFFIGTIFIFYYFGKYLGSKKIGLGAAFLFCFSWLSIAMFREARFYEMFICFFFISAFIICRFILLFLNQEFLFSHLIKFLFSSYNITYFIFIILFLIISFDSQLLTLFILYPLFTFGILVFLLKNRLAGFLISLTSLLALISSFYLKHKIITLSSLIFYSGGGTWREYINNSLFDEFFNFYINHEYIFISIILFFILLIVFLSIEINKLAVIYLIIFNFILYSIIAIQGYGIATIRYFYFIFPFFFLLFAYLLQLLLISYKKYRFPKIVVITILLLILSNCIYVGLTESFSPNNYNSAYYMKNINYDEYLSYFKNNLNQNRNIITETHTSLQYFLYFNKTSDFYLVDKSKLGFASGNYLNITLLDYHNLLNKTNNSYILILARYPGNIEIIDYLDKNAKKEYSLNDLKIYSIG